MAIVLNAIGKRRKGSVGGETYRIVGGQTVVGEKPVSGSYNPSPLQQWQNDAISTITPIGTALLGLINFGFKPKSKNRSPFNEFVAYNVKNAVQPMDSGYTGIIPDNLLVSQGKITPTAITSATGDVSAQTLTATWSEYAYYKGQSDNDIPLYAVHNETQDLWSLRNYTNDIRTDGTSNLVRPSAFIITDVIRVYLFFQNPVTKMVSTSTNMLITLSA